MTWEDAATGLRVEFVVLSHVDPVNRGEHNRVPKPIDGPQFCVTAPMGGGGRCAVGAARTAEQLAALGVSAETIAAIEAVARPDAYREQVTP
jgi:hypothetical protein